MKQVIHAELPQLSWSPINHPERYLPVTNLWFSTKEKPLTKNKWQSAQAGMRRPLEMMHMCYLHPAVPSLPFIHALIKEVPCYCTDIPVWPRRSVRCPFPWLPYFWCTPRPSGEREFTARISNIFLFPTEKAKVACGLKLERAWSALPRNQKAVKSNPA